VLMTVAVIANLNVGCSEDKPAEPDGGGSGAITIDEIIFNPKSPALGDTMLATAVVTGNAVPGDFVTYQWTASSGELLDTDKSVVRWVAPTTSEAVQIDVTAKNSASSASGSYQVFVNDIQTYVPSRGGELHLSATGDSLISQYSPQPPESDNFIGFGIRVHQGPTANESFVLFANQGGSNIRFSHNYDRAAFNLAGNLGLLQMNIIDVVSGVRTALPFTPYGPRGPQYKEADFLPGNSDLMTYQVWWPDQDKIPQIGGVDTFQVVVYDVPAGKEKRVVTLGNNFFPTFSPDGRWLLFASDRTTRFEYHAVAVNGTDVAVDSIDGSTQLTDSSGRMGPEKLIRAWSPTAPVLAVVDRTGTTWLIAADGSSAKSVAASGNVRDFAWAPNGNFLVMAAANRVYRVGTGGRSTLIYAAPNGDRITRLAISWDQNFLLYLDTRLTRNWYELIDLSGVTGITGPLRVTPGAAPGVAGQYQNLMSLSPVWIPGQTRAYMLSFDGGVNTPRINSMDFSNLLPTP
jgi:hypothetical protein